MIWKSKAKTYNLPVSNIISRNRFDALRRYLHYNDNVIIDKNIKIYKIQPFFDQINCVPQENFQQVELYFSLDEAKEP